jgi:hypothetical protein
MIVHDEPSNAERLAIIEARCRQMEALYLAWARGAKRGYRWLNIATIGFSAAVPVVVLVASLFGADKAAWVPACAGILGACATLAKSVDSLFKNHDTWLRNNDAFGRLRGEQFLFQERAGRYRQLSLDERISLYAERVEEIIGSETLSWTGAENRPQGGSA